MNYFVRKLGSWAEAEDLTQEVFVRLIRYPEPSELDRPEGLVFTIAANLVRDRIRSEQSRQVIGNPGAAQAFETNAHGASELVLVDELDPERTLIGRQRLALLISALGELSELRRDIFLMFQVHGIPQREIAARCGISISAVEKHIAKALAHLAKTGRQHSSPP
jgi:RNA polymerase sigma-70 factor (ECF subfamily)